MLSPDVKQDEQDKYTEYSIGAVRQYAELLYFSAIGHRLGLFQVITANCSCSGIYHVQIATPVLQYK